MMRNKGAIVVFLTICFVSLAIAKKGITVGFAPSYYGVSVRPKNDCSSKIGRHGWCFDRCS